MTRLDTLKNRLIDSIMASKNEKLLSSLEGIMTSVNDEEPIDFSSEQLEMLMLAEEDIKAGRFLSQEELDNQDAEWLT